MRSYNWKENTLLYSITKNSGGTFAGLHMLESHILGSSKLI